jgi:poly(3-hydroxybutyrate) depolymerase
MIYQNFQVYSDFTGPLRAAANFAASTLAQAVPGVPRNVLVRAVGALCELIARAGLSHHRPAFGIDRVTIGGRSLAVREVAVHRTPFCTLLHLEKEVETVQPRVLMVAPMSGPFRDLAARCRGDAAGRP